MPESKCKFPGLHANINPGLKFDAVFHIIVNSCAEIDSEIEILIRELPIRLLSKLRVRLL